MKSVERHIHTKSPAIVIAVLSLAVLSFGLGSYGGPEPEEGGLFSDSSSCQSCHNNLGMENGENLSIGTSWKSTMMAHSGVDVYWLAGVRREITDHPAAAGAIQDECSKCHKSMQRYINHTEGLEGRVFDDEEEASTAHSALALDGVSCTMCHQIKGDNLGTEESFVGGFEIEQQSTGEARRIFGPFEIAQKTRRVMQSSTGFEPVKADHIKKAELCATCHTLYTHSLDEKGNDLGRFPEQVPYQEWQHGIHGKKGVTCQDCHMVRSDRDNVISSVLGKPRKHFSKHSFSGGNFLVPQLMAQHPGKHHPRASAEELEAGVKRTRAHLALAAARISVEPAQCADGILRTTVTVKNRAGHKLPTAYPSRRVWIRFTVKNAEGKSLFESGALNPDGSINGNDNDLDAQKYEPHYSVITSPDQVQIYEPIMGRPDGSVTTGLLQATQYLKDNRLLPNGFDKSKAHKDVAVHGAAAGDAEFKGGSHTVTYETGPVTGGGPYTITAGLWYQPIGHRWAMNLADYDLPEPARFVMMYKSVSGKDTAVMLAQDTIVVEDAPAAGTQSLPDEAPVAPAEDAP